MDVYASYPGDAQSPLSSESDPDVVDILLPAMKKLRIGWAGGAPLPTKVTKADVMSEIHNVLGRPAS